MEWNDCSNSKQVCQSIDQVEHLREIQIDTCSANNRKERSNYGHSHEKLQITLFSLEKHSNMEKQSSCSIKVCFSNRISKQAFLHWPSFAALKKRNSNILISLRHNFICHAWYLKYRISLSYRVLSRNQAIICEFRIGCQNHFSPSFPWYEETENHKKKIIEASNFIFIN